MTVVNEDLDLGRDEFTDIDREPWYHVGTVMSIHMQPMLSGKTIATKNYGCNSVGLIAMEDDFTVIRKKLVFERINFLNLKFLTTQVDDIIAHTEYLAIHDVFVVCK